MSVKEKLDAVAQDIEDAYTTVLEKGGSTPEGRGTANLAAAISSIPIGVTEEQLEEALASKQPLLTGQPGQVVGFDADGAAVATDMPAQAKGGSGTQLLDNGYLLDPANQRGKTEYASPGYTIDRWILRSGTVNGPSSSLLLGADGSVAKVQLGNKYGQFVQELEYDRLKGLQLTVSLLCADVIGDNMLLILNDGTQQPNAAIQNGLVSTTITVSQNAVHLFCGVQNNDQDNTASLRPIAMKLELGDRQTLAHQDEDGSWVLNDPPPNKALELLKCQRYYYQSWNPKAPIACTSYAISTLRMSAVDFPVRMRATPAIRIYSGTITSGPEEEDAVHPWSGNTVYGAVASYTGPERFIPGTLNKDLTAGTIYTFYYTATADL